jgi:hypothetical protein
MGAKFVKTEPSSFQCLSMIHVIEEPLLYRSHSCADSPPDLPTLVGRSVRREPRGMLMRLHAASKSIVPDLLSVIDTDRSSAPELVSSIVRGLSFSSRNPKIIMIRMS